MTMSPAPSGGATAASPEARTPTARRARVPALASGLTAAALLPEAARAAREPYSVKRWLAYVQAAEAAQLPVCAVFGVYERAVAALPGSYKLWRAYALRARAYGAPFHPEHPARSHGVSVSRRAAEALRAAPRLWEDLLAHYAAEGLLHEARQALNDALRALPVTQHDRIWTLTLRKLVPRVGPLTAVALLIRYATLRPGPGELHLFEYRRKMKMWNAAVAGLVKALGDKQWDPPGKKTRDMLWIEAAEIASRHPRDIVSVDVPAFLRSGLADAKAGGGLRTVDLYQLLARYYVRRGLFEEARAVYEEAVNTVMTVRDFAVLYDAYAKFEEGLVTAAMEDVEEIREEGDEADDEELKDAEAALELLMARLEHLTDRRPMLLSDVWIRQNPHNVHEWHKRARLFRKAGDPTAVVHTYTRAIGTVDPLQASNGRPHTLWLAFASYYESANDADSARKVLEKAVSEPDKFAQPQDLAAVWCEYAEMELRLQNPKLALEVLTRATVQPEEDRRREQSRANSVGSHAKNGIVHYDHSEKGRALSAWKSNRLWSFLLDLTESLESADKVITLYHRMLDLRIATAQNVLNGGEYLESKRLFEQAFRLYDRGTSCLQWPEALRVWVVYLTRFVKRHGSGKLERARSLFEEAIRAAPSGRKFGRDVPNENLPLLFRMYADAEERAGVPRRSMAVLARGARAVTPAQRADMYRLYIARMGALFGVTKTRAIFEEALGNLTAPEEVLEFARRFADAETQLGEIDRARAIFKHAAEVADARAPPGTPSGSYWKAWHDFELAHGSEDSFRDMLRVKRRVLMLRADTHLAAPAAGGVRGNEAADVARTEDVEMAEEVDGKTGEGSMAALERRAEAAAAAKAGEEVAEGVAKRGSTAGGGGDEEIELDLDSGDDEEDGTAGGDVVEDSAEEGLEGVAEVDDGEPEKAASSDVNGESPNGKSGKPVAAEKVGVALKEVPQGVKNLLSRAKDFVGEKRKHDGMEGAGAEEKEQNSAKKRSLGALERFKRQRK